MSDEIDQAQANDEFFRELALRSRRPLSVPVSDEKMETAFTDTDDGHGQRICLDCGEPIPEARRKAVPGCTRCVTCQTEFEQIHTHWRAL